MSSIEVAPGIDIERDILALMDFKPLIPRDPRLMDARIFRDGAMDLRNDMLDHSARSALHLRSNSRTCSSSISSASWCAASADIKAIEKAAEAKLAPLGRRVYAIVNYDNFSIPPELLDEYSAMVRSLTDRFYSGVSRYTTSGFLRIKLGEALENRGVAPHIFESADEAKSDWRKVEGTPG